MTDLPSSVRDLTLDLTAVASSVTMAATLLKWSDRPGDPTPAAAVMELWEALTGLEGDAAVEAAQAICRHPLPVTAGVIPF